jgi:hypothetical protein
VREVLIDSNPGCADYLKASHDQVPSRTDLRVRLRDAPLRVRRHIVGQIDGRENGIP